jgi:hypothetical protein
MLLLSAEADWLLGEGNESLVIIIIDEIVL